MADNANKMGTDLASIQYAYQGFAKQNLHHAGQPQKLGYGGTQAEMARLINDSGVLGDTMEVTAETVNQVSFDKIVEAIHVVQDEMGITGTTADEAATTIQGSISSMKAAWDNFLAGMADPEQDFDALLGNLVDSVVTVGQNLVPRIQMLLPRLAEGLDPVGQQPAAVHPDHAAIAAAYADRRGFQPDLRLYSGFTGYYHDCNFGHSSVGRGGCIYYWQPCHCAGHGCPTAPERWSAVAQSVGGWH